MFTQTETYMSLRKVHIFKVEMKELNLTKYNTLYSTLYGQI